MVLWKWARIFLLSCKNGKNGDWSEYFIDDSFSYLHSNRFLISLHCRAILLCLKNIWISVPSHTPVMREILLGFGLTLVSFLYLLWICMYSPRKSKPTQLYTKIATVDNISSHSCLQHSRLIIFSFITTVMILLLHSIYGCAYCLHGCETLSLRISVHLIDLRAVGHGEMLAKFWSGHWRKLWWFNGIIFNACVSFLAVAETVRLVFAIISSWAFIVYPLLLLLRVAGGDCQKLKL